MDDTSVCGVTGTDLHSTDCRYLGNDAWDCGKLDNQSEFIRPITEMRICEINRVFLHPDQLYRFTVDASCGKCMEYARHTPGWDNLDLHTQVLTHPAE